MHFVIHCIDKPNSTGLRSETRPAHLAYLEGWEQKIVTGGPMLSEDGQSMVGSLIILDCADIEEARNFAANDPYALAGLFDTVAIRPWRRVFPKA